MEWIFSLDEIKDVARQWWEAAKGHRVFAFHGEMGSGKTTFIHALCDQRGVHDPVGSPTFSLVNQYAFQDGDEEGLIYHIDLYRIKDEEEAVRAGIEECLYSGATCFVEWPEKAPGIFPPGTAHVFISGIDPDTRNLILRFNGDNH